PLADFRGEVGGHLRQAAANYGGGTEGLRHGLAEVVRRPHRDVMAQGGVVALVGPTGVGKTTSVAKIAARYAMRHGYDQVALVTTDSYRIAAHEQLRTYARILGVPVRVANDADELRTTLDNLADRSLVLIDTAGMSQRDRRLAEQFHTLVTGAPTVQTYAVLAANTQPGGLEETVHAFRGAELDGCVLTKIDESTGLGPALSTIIDQSLPLAFLSDGQRVPEDLHDGGPALLANRLTEIAALPEPVEAVGVNG
ncbi:MAG: AAA family ATPase, partial [Thiohalospira sp.]